MRVGTGGSMAAHEPYARTIVPAAIVACLFGYSHVLFHMANFSWPGQPEL